MTKREIIRESIKTLPVNINPDSNIQAVGVMRKWTDSLPLRAQGVLVTAIRGCDVAPKEDTSKTLTRLLRRVIMNPADERETTHTGGFFGFDPTKTEDDLFDFLHSLDQYPLHYVMHLTHAYEIVGYWHPDIHTRLFFSLVYNLITETLHFVPEQESQLSSRMREDRVANGTVATNHPKNPARPASIEPVPVAIGRAQRYCTS